MSKSAVVLVFAILSLAEPVASVAITLTSMEPELPTRDGEVTVTGRVTNITKQRLYRLVMYRDLPVRIDGYDYTLYIRNDLLPLYNQIRY